MIEAADRPGDFLDGHTPHQDRHDPVAMVNDDAGDPRSGPVAGIWI
jgi:hypothetical protein